MPAFEAAPRYTYDKTVGILCPGDLFIMVDYDDVWKREIDVWIEWVVDTLNREYDNHGGPELPEYDEDAD